MSAMLKRPGSEEGLEIPLKEEITRMILCVMFGLDDKEDIHIFNSTGEKVAFLFNLNCSFTPQTPGDYIIKLDSEVQNSGDHKQMTSGNNSAMDAESSTSNNYIQNDDSWVLNSQPGCSKDMEKRVERQYALLKRPGCEEGIELGKGMPISKGMICELFGLDDSDNLIILTSSEVFSDTLSEECSLLCKEDFFSPGSAVIYTVMTESEFKSTNESEDMHAAYNAQLQSKLRSEKKSFKFMPKVFGKLPNNLFHRILNTMSYEAFCRLAMTCREMMSILQLDSIVKESPLTLNVTSNELPDNSEHFVFYLATKERPKYFWAEIQPYCLSDLRPFLLEAVRVKGDENTGVPKECLPLGCREIKRHNVAFKTFISICNRLQIVVEILEILKPRRAEIWLVSYSPLYQRAHDYGEGFSGREWPFGNVGEELKLITSSFDYIQDMSRHRGMFYFISRLKIFQAFCVLPLSFSVTALVLREFLANPEMGNIRMVQFLYPEDVNTNDDIFGGIPRFYEDEIQQTQTDMNTTGVVEVRPRIRAGIASNNGERMAIVESRKYSNFRVVTMAFTRFDGYIWQLQRIYLEFDELHKTVDVMFKEE